MKVEVLISCMHQKDYSIIKNSNIQTDVVVVNQCDEDSRKEFDFHNDRNELCHALFINTKERGLSKSRNMALKNSRGDVCLICDDDENLSDSAVENIKEAYRNNPDAGCVTFALDRKDFPTIYPLKPKKLSYKMILQTSSQQISFKRNQIIDKLICFDEKMGSGTKNGGGEENKFLLDCRRKGIKMYYSPDIIATINKGESQWFHGYTDKYMRNQGWASRRILGDFLGFLYCFYFCLRHRNVIKKDIPLKNAIIESVKGYFEKR